MLDALLSLDGDSVDTCLTDPPYGLGFMSQGWDHAVPGPVYWEAILRALKPGAPLAAFGGTKTHHRLMCAIEDAGFEIRDCLMWLYGQGMPKGQNLAKATGDPRWEGWNTVLKPGVEPIILAMKPLDGTFAENAARHDVAGLNIDAARDRGRYPSNLVLSHHPDCTFRGTERRRPGSGGGQAGRLSRGFQKGGGFVGGARVPDGHTGGFTGEDGLEEVEVWDCHEDCPIREIDSTTGAEKGKAGASRFFYCTKAPKSERTHYGRVENRHPTVKPLALMRWLCRLTAPPGGGVVLDPFCGSGSTGVAAILEGRSFIGIELDPAHAEVACERLRDTWARELRQ